MSSASSRATDLRRAADYLSYRSGDGLALAGDALERARYSLPLRDILEERWRALMENKADTELAVRVDAMRSACIEHLRQTADSIEAGAILDEVRGILATVVGVLTVDPPDPVAVDRAASILDTNTPLLAEIAASLRDRQFHQALDLARRRGQRRGQDSPVDI